MKKYIYYILMSVLFLGISACSDYLETVPDNRTTLDSPEKIQELLVNAYPTASYVHITEFMSDNAGEKGSSRDATDNSRDAYMWSEIFHNVAQDSPEYIWTEFYSNIGAANQALRSLDELGIEGDEIDALRAEAQVTRAYAHFMLVNLWGKSYDPATASSDLGVPIVTEPEDVVFKEYERASVQEVYDFIDQELAEAIPNLNDNYLPAQAKKYHFNVLAAHAFATRFYLYKGEWQKAVDHSDNVLTGDVASKLIDWNGERTNMTHAELNNNFTPPTQPANLLVIEASSWYGRRYATQRYGLTLDIRQKTVFASNPTGGSYAYRVFGTSTAYNVPKFSENFVPSTPGGNTGLGYTEFPLFRMEEVLLNRAEAYTMLNDYQSAVDDLNTFYSKRIRDYSPSNHSVDKATVDNFYDANPDRMDGLDPFYEVSSEQLNLLQTIVNERRADFMHEGLRWFDIRRFHIEIVHHHGTSENVDDQDPEVLPGDSPAHQLQIPATASDILQPNPR